MNLSSINYDRAVFLFDYFYNETSEKIVSKLLELDNQANDTIYLFINSYGGAVNDLVAILDTINNIKSPVSTICLGEADSCGAVLLASGEKGMRYIGEQSRVMIHEVSALTFGKVSELEESLKIANEYNDVIVNNLAKATNKSYDYIKEFIKGNDKWFKAKETIEFGLADKVLSTEEALLITNSINKKFIRRVDKMTEDLKKDVEVKETVKQQTLVAENQQVEVENLAPNKIVSIPAELEKRLAELEAENKILKEAVIENSVRQDLIEAKANASILENEEMFNAFKKLNMLDRDIYNKMLQIIKNSAPANAKKIEYENDGVFVSSSTDFITYNKLKAQKEKELGRKLTISEIKDLMTNLGIQFKE